MKIEEELYYSYEAEKYISDKLNVSKGNLQTTLKAVYDACVWLENSEFQTLIMELRIQLVDTPLLDTLAFMGIEETESDIVIFLNILHLVVLYENGEYKDKFLLDDMSCYEFALFVFLHEVGHFIHGVLQYSGDSTYEKITNALLEQNKEYEALEKYLNKIGFKEGESSKKIHRIACKKYRKLKCERQADKFSLNNMKNVKKSRV